MANKSALVIVESPAKARTIQYFLGSGYKVQACMGHIKDLPKRKLGVDVDHGFTPTYQIIKGKEKVISSLKSGAKDSSRVLLATDPDREGETICWHLKEELKSINSNIFRILFQEITQDAIKDALKNLTTLDINKVDAGKARRILDRLVGYKISPLLWKKVRKGLSAGRVQTVALRFVVEREKEIEAFISEEYYLIFGKFSSSEGDFLAQLKKIKGKKFSRLSKEDAYGKKEDIERQSFMVKSVVIKEEKKSPPPPFITSTLQQEAHRLFRFSSGRTMAIAQSLYEGVDIAEKRTGLITYMRTDSFRIATLAQKKARDYIGERFGEEYLPTSPPRYKSRKGAQEAHEAIRPTYVELAPEKVKEYLDQGQFKLYSLIYNRFLASQMARAIIEVRTVEVKGGDYIFAADERKTKFAGYQILFKREERKDVPSLPLLREGEEVDLIELRLEQKFTQPPPRYTEGTLIRKLEEEGIGRPSTYAPIMNVIKDRDYVRSIKGQLHPTELGRIVVDLLVENFPSIFHAKFTSKIEKSLDEIEENKKRWRKIVEDFYESFEPALEKAFVEMKNIKKERERPTGEECPRCGGALIIKEGRYGEFLACSNFPKCRYTRGIIKKLGILCPEESCSGEVVEMRNRKGRVFYGCSNYPECRWTSSVVPADKSKTLQREPERINAEERC